MTSVGYVTVDVFTSVRFGGNPLAVIPDAHGLSDDAMAAIAREFNYSETTFVLPPADPANTARVRIFTPTSELPFAGHPNVGTGYVLGRLGTLFGKPTADVLRFEENAGLVVVELIRDVTGVVGATITAPQPFSLGPVLDRAKVAECVGLTPSAIVTTRHQPQYASVGLPFLCVEISNLASLGKAVPNTTLFRAAQDELADPGLEFNVYAYTVASTDPFTVRARMFAPLDGVPEDPATGSAAGALGALLTYLRPDADLNLHFPILQGIEMGRPSQIDLAVSKRKATIERVEISGRCVDAMRGTLVL